MEAIVSQWPSTACALSVNILVPVLAIVIVCNLATRLPKGLRRAKLSKKVFVSRDVRRTHTAQESMQMIVRFSKENALIILK